MKTAIALTFLACAALGGPACAQLRESRDCSNSADRQAINAGFEQERDKLLSQLQQRQVAHQAATDAKIDQLIKHGAWKPDDKKAFYDQLAQSPEYAGFERQRQLPVMSYQFDATTAIGRRDKDPLGACQFANDALATLIELAKINESEYQLIDQRLAEAAKAKNVSLAP